MLFRSATDVVLDYRASTFHPPTLDLLENSGITAALVAMGLVCPTVQIRDREIGKVAEFDMTRLAKETPHPYRRQCEQFKLVGFVYRELAKIAGIDLRMRHDVAVDVARPNVGDQHASELALRPGAIRKPGPRGQGRAPVPGSWSGGGNRAFDWRYRLART